MHKKVALMLSALLMAVFLAVPVTASTAPDYSKPESWYKVPEITKDVDTFYILATEYMGFNEGDSDYAELDNPELVEGTHGQYLLHASVYEESTNVFLPYYRQSSLRYAGEVRKKTGGIDAALSGRPYEDITAALDYYFENYNGGRPFILAGHSQGSALAKLVLKKYFKEHPDYYKRMVAAYVIGFAVTKDELAENPHLKFATGESDAGVIVSWNTEGKRNVELNATNVVLMPGGISINPLNWKLDDTYAPASENLGSLIVDEKTQTLKIGDVGADAQIVLERGSIVTNAKIEPMPEVLAAVASEFFGPDGRHESDYTFFYNNIKANVAKRIATYKKNADLVVYGKIFTSEGNLAEAFAVKDGRYVYVGDKAGAEEFVGDKTEVIDYTGKGLVMPGCGNGHAHYMLGYALKTVGTTIDMDDEPNHFLKETVPAAVKNAKDKGATSVFGQGWNYMRFKDNLPTRQQLDAICSDIPMYFLDDECHKALVNSVLLVKAGIMKEDGTVLMKELRGGEIGIGEDGTPNGYLAEQAQTYMRSFLDNDSLYTLDMAISNLAEIEHHMLSEGYTMYHEGWGNYFVNTNYYQAVQQMDKAGKLHFVLGLPYEIESWMDMDEALSRAVDAKKFASKRVMPRWIKLLMDGTVETGTGYVDPLYPDGHQGIPNWTEDELTELTRKANEKGLTIHIHALGNKAVNCAVNAFVNGGKDEMRNTLVHVRNVNQPDYQRIADHNIYVTSGVTWHHMPTGGAEELRELGATPAGQEDKSYPFKSFFDNGIPVSIHSDYPALSGSPDDPFGIMEIAVTGVLHSENGAPWWPEELATREQALTALTINCAKQMFIEDERGSVKEGKYADFLLVDKDVLTCPATEIHTAKPNATYFEGKKVFEVENKKITGDYDKSLAVKCVNGTFVGKKTENVITYKGIPFVGKQPVGELRWKAPVDVVPDDAVYEAYYFGKAACQSLEIGEHQGEDCLYLNVWKADDKSTKKKPVMVWIHGGAFTAGGTGIEVFDCTNFVKENPDVIVVTIQYRLGALGFLNLSHLPDGKDYPDAQNLGLMDQRMALKWVHENIANFGGDPDNVTIWGESAGAGSVTLLPLMKDSQKYFKRAIVQSGSVSQTNSSEEAIANTNDLMNALGCKTVADLMKLDARKLVDTAGEVIAFRIFPVRDGSILPLDPYGAYANGAAKDITFLQGCNKDEMNCFVFDWGVENFKAWAADRKTKKYAHLLTDEEKALIESYCNEGAVESWEPDSRLFSHSWFIDGAVRMSESQTKGGGKSYTYYYRVESSPELKAAHFEEVPIIFCHPEMSGGRQDYDETFSKTMRKMWVQFAKTGNPSLSAEDSPDGKAKTWPLYDLENKNVMVLDEFDIHPAKESEVKIVDWERTYFLTKYYML